MASEVSRVSVNTNTTNYQLAQNNGSEQSSSIFGTEQQSGMPYTYGL